MEDKHIIYDNIFNDSTVGFFSVFDGHGGKDVVTYCANFIPDLFKE
jgi:serine/threonine protein phosphatase PrpC